MLKSAAGIGPGAAAAPLGPDPALGSPRSGEGACRVSPNG